MGQDLTCIPTNHFFPLFEGLGNVKKHENKMLLIIFNASDQIRLSKIKPYCKKVQKLSASL